MKDKYLLPVDSDKYYKLMNQEFTHHYLLPTPSVFNAIWDGFLTSKGELYFSLCTELTTSEYAKLAKLNRETDNIEELFYTKNTYFNNERLIRDSKIHTAIDEMEDGRLIMLTHTTDKAPEHPAWLPNAYYSNPWTGYAGSQLLIFNPADDKVEYLGIPVHRETLYGAVYSKKTKCYYALGFLKGHLYKINPLTMEVKDYGQVVERASYRLIEAKDENIYFSTRNGILMKLDTDLDEVVNLKHQLPLEKGKKKGYISYIVNGPDDRLYISTQFTDVLSAYDYETDTLECIGSYKNYPEYSNADEGHDHMASMDFDKNGVLYGTICHIRASGGENFKVPTGLVRWDILGNKEPEYLGIVGSVAKAVVTTASLIMDHKTDEMFIFGTNHGNDSPDILKVDLSKYRDVALDISEDCKDPYINPLTTDYLEHDKSIRTTFEYWNNNSFYAMVDKVIPVAIWQDLNLNPDGFSISNIVANNENINVFSNEQLKLTYSYEGELLNTEKVAEVSTPDDVECKETKLKFAYPGRQFDSGSVATIELSNKKKVHVTADGLLSLEISKNNFRNYGPVWINAHLVSWVKLNNSDVIYGLAGDKDDFTNLFRFSEEEGINWLGYLGVDSVGTGAFSSPNGGLITVDDNDQHLVVSSAKMLSSMYIYNIGGK